MSWPVPDTFMIEPTESESKEELDRFCDAMLSIRDEIREIQAGKVSVEQSVLKNAPHGYHLLTDDSWPFDYGRDRAFFPSAATRRDKYWPPVGRVDNVHGDRHLVCTCPPIDAYIDDAA